MPGDKQHTLVGLYPTSHRSLPLRRNNFTGATRTLQKAYVHLQKQSRFFLLNTVRPKTTLQYIDKSLHLLSTYMPFQSFLLPIIDDTLKKEVEQAIPLLQQQNKEYIIHKHKLRDRSDILLLRETKRRSRRY